MGLNLEGYGNIPNGRKAGITGNVDLNRAYKDYPAIIKNKKLNGFNTKLHVGSKVKIKEGAKSYKNITLAPFVYTKVYDVMEIKGDRAVIGLHNQVTTDINVCNLIQM